MTMIAGGRCSGTGSWLVLVLGCASRVALSLIDRFEWHQLITARKVRWTCAGFSNIVLVRLITRSVFLLKSPCPLSPSDGVF
jgi:hypothetical protein